MGELPCPQGVSPSTSSCPMGTAAESLPPTSPPRRVMARGSPGESRYSQGGAGPGGGDSAWDGAGLRMWKGLGPTGHCWLYPQWVVCRRGHSRWCSTSQPRGSRHRCHTAPDRVPESPAAPRGTCQALLQHGGSLVTTRTAAAPASCFPQPLSWHGLGLQPAPIVASSFPCPAPHPAPHPPSQSPVLPSATSLTPTPV